ncbi:DUF4326 domain-containing protein [Nonomuraea sp. NPDC046802]|uniref:DUF4326 domain-containing protein n=1 Tax=Nonomuraea sp. NPDC046802 TaxID=3154919 RepID=UPI0033CF1850
MDETRQPKRIQRRRVKGWRKGDRCTIVDRTSKWGNPWAVTLDPNRGWRVHPADDTGLLSPRIVGWWEDRDRAALVAVDLYRRHLATHPEMVVRAREVLAGRDLACPCPLPHGKRDPDLCHAALLIAVANFKARSNQGWDGGCWIVLDRDCEPIGDYHHHSEAGAHSVSIPLDLFVRRVPCGVEPVGGRHA